MKIVVENIKCGGCVNSIKKKIADTFATKNIDIDVESGLIDIDIAEDSKDQLKKLLSSLGYPEVGDNSIGKKAKSFVSCAIGKMSKDGS